MTRLAEVVDWVHQRYPESLAEDWDAVGLVVGDPDDQVGSVLLAVDPAPTVVDEALELGVDLLLTHHPLFLRPVSSMAAITPKGRAAHRLAAAGVGLLCAHTNADSAVGGVSDALAEALGVLDATPLQPHLATLDKLVVFVPGDAAEAVIDAVAAAGAGEIGDYERCAWSVGGQGTFRPLRGANPTIGSVGEVERVLEHRVEMVVPRDRRASVVDALRRAHPYEEPAFDIHELAPTPTRAGLGRVGRLRTPTPLGDFAALVARVLPDTTTGVRAAGDPRMLVERVAVCGGAGDSLLEAARRAGADAYVTADLRHHPTSESAAVDASMALVDVSHWASEWLWLPVVAEELESHCGVTATVSRRCTDPWTIQHTP